MKSIPYGRQQITDEDVAAVSAALRDAFLTQGPRVGEFEERLAGIVGARYAVAVNSGTAALHAAYFAASVGPGKAVLTTPITFVATVNSSLYLGGSAHLRDIDADTVLLDPAGLSDAPADTSAVVPVHFGGQAADMERISGIARRNGWVVIEDAAHALGAKYRTSHGKEFRVGECAHSAMCCFSFHPVKHVTTGEGGAVTTNDEALYRALLRFRSHGITRDPRELQRNEGAWYYEQHDLGFNYRITDFQCALGLSQLERLDEYVARRREIAARYDRLFAEEPEVRPTGVPSWSTGSYHLYVVRVDASVRRQTFDALRADGIGVNVHYIPVNQQPYHRAHGLGDADVPNADRYYAEAITLPMHSGLSDEDVDFVAERVTHHLRLAAR
jgi:perosamine synthetase